MAEPFCTKPWMDLELGDTRHATCCPAWLDKSAFLRDCRECDPWKIWHAEPFQRLRRTVAAGDTSLCRKCPWLLSGTTPRDQLPGTGPAPTYGPRVLADLVDRTCNLHCRSCRQHPVARPDDWRERAGKLIGALERFAPGLEMFSTNQVGDPFASPVSRAALRCVTLRDCPAELRICTNGLLMPHVWPTIPEQTRARLLAVHLSIDAASGETYELLRRGAHWDVLVDAIGWLAMLRESGRPKILLYQFVIQTENWREMPAFVDLARHGRATRVIFTHLRRFGQSKEDWSARTLANPDHPDAADIDKMLAFDPILQDPIVERRHLHPDNRAEVWRAGSSRE